MPPQPARRAYLLSRSLQTCLRCCFGTDLLERSGDCLTRSCRREFVNRWRNCPRASRQGFAPSTGNEGCSMLVLAVNAAPHRRQHRSHVAA